MYLKLGLEKTLKGLVEVYFSEKGIGGYEWNN